MRWYRRLHVVAVVSALLVAVAASTVASAASTGNLALFDESSAQSADVAVAVDAGGDMDVVSSAQDQSKDTELAHAGTGNIATIDGHPTPAQMPPSDSPGVPPVGEDGIVPTQVPAPPEADAARAERRPAEHPDIAKARQRAAALTAADEPDLIGECVPLERAPLPNNTIRADDVPPGFDLAAALRELEERKQREQAEAAAAAARG